MNVYICTHLIPLLLVCLLVVPDCSVAPWVLESLPPEFLVPVLSSCSQIVWVPHLPHPPPLQDWVERKSSLWDISHSSSFYRCLSWNLDTYFEGALFSCKFCIWRLCSHSLEAESNSSVYGSIEYDPVDLCWDLLPHISVHMCRYFLPIFGYLSWYMSQWCSRYLQELIHPINEEGDCVVRPTPTF